jgi:chromate transport protein ChrA
MKKYINKLTKWFDKQDNLTKIATIGAGIFIVIVAFYVLIFIVKVIFIAILIYFLFEIAKRYGKKNRRRR